MLTSEDVERITPFPFAIMHSLAALVALNTPFMRRNSELKSSVSFLKKQEFIEKAELFNSYRVGAVHRMRRTNLDTLAVELQKVKGCFDEIFDLYNDIQDDFRVIFHSLQ